MDDGLRLVHIQRIEADNAARVAGGHSRADINALGEPAGGPPQPCSCGCEVCAGSFREHGCAGGITVLKPGAMIELHLCAVHLAETSSRWPCAQRDPQGGARDGGPAW